MESHVVWQVVTLLVTLTRVTVSQSGTLHYSMMEELPAFTVVGDVKTDYRFESLAEAQDIDGSITFSMLTDQEDEDAKATLFSVDQETGVLSTSEVIDREAICLDQISCVAQLTVMAVAAPNFFLSIPISITILDDNDHGPNFTSNSFSLVISESAPESKSFDLPLAQDEDTAELSVQNYYLVPEVANLGLEVRQSLDGTTQLMLVVKAPLDRESQASYSLRLVAEDGGNPPRNGSLLLNISVGDVNDSPPVFNKSSYQASLLESSGYPRTVIQLRAHDPDLGRGGSVVYSFTEKTLQDYGDVFSIDSESGLVTLEKQLDYEEESRYQLVAEASDGGQDPRKAHVILTILVLDVNDNQPRISVHTVPADQEPAVSEVAPTGSFVALISASDKDSGENGAVTCTLSDYGMNTFLLERILNIQKTQYKIVTSRTLDAEVRDQYTLNVRCVDNGSVRLSSSIHLSVSVTDYNDHKPEFSQSQYVKDVQENNHVGASLFLINVTDKDSDDNGRVRFTISSNPHNLLQIDPSTGLVTANGVFDREVADSFEFTVVAEDFGEPPLQNTAVIIINVKDENDEIPEFSRDEYTFVIQENEAPFSWQQQIQAEDKDLPPYNRTSYSIQSDPELTESVHLFTVDPSSGKLNALVSFDREEKPMHRFLLVATDVNKSDMTSSTIVTVYVADKNDNWPKLDFPNGQNRSVQISSQLSIGERVCRVYAHDLDSGFNGKLTYRFVHKDQNGKNKKDDQDETYFVLDPNSGEVTSARDLSDIDFRRFLIHIAVADQGTPFRNITGILEIVVDSTIAVDLPGGGVDSSKKKTGSAMSNSNMTVLICLVATSGVVALLLVVAIIFVVVRNRRMKALHQRRYYDSNGGFPDNGQPAGSSDKRRLGRHGNLGSSGRTVDGAEDAGLWAPAKSGDRSSKSSSGTNTQGYTYSGNNIKPMYLQADSPEPQVITQVNQSADSGFDTNSDVIINKALMRASLNEKVDKPADKRELRAQRLLTFLASDADSESGCSEEASNTDSGRGTINEEQEPPAKGVHSHMGHQPSVHCHHAGVHVPPVRNGGITSLPPQCHCPSDDKMTSSTQGPARMWTVPTPANTDSQNNNTNMAAKQTLRNVKARDRSKKSQMWSPEQAQYTSYPVSDEGKPPLPPKTYRATPAIGSFSDSNSLMKNKANSRLSVGSSEVTDDATSTTSGSYVLNLEEPFYNVADITV